MKPLIFGFANSVCNPQLTHSMGWVQMVFPKLKWLAITYYLKVLLTEESDTVVKTLDKNIMIFVNVLIMTSYYYTF